MPRPVALVILDGWGLGPQNEANPIHVVDPPVFKLLRETYPMTSLQASGISVGLPWGEVGNSEVGHLTLGAGKVVYQYYPKISLALQDGSFFENPVLKSAFEHARANGSAVNLAGLLTKANTHASAEHLAGLIQMGEKEGVPVKLHLFADGLDSPPKSLFELLGRPPQERIGSLTGRYYAMDRNGNWNLIQKAYNCMTGSEGQETPDIAAALEFFFKKGMSEEFLPPLRPHPELAIADKDALIFFNFREDGMREMAEAFLGPDFSEFQRREIRDLKIVMFTRYEDKWDAPVAFPADMVERPLGQVLAEAGKSQLRLAESYKYAHVTYFFSGRREPPFPGEYRAVVPSMNVTHPDEHPELMASAVTDRLLEAIQNRGFDFMLVNYSNPDTIAHTGNYQACLETVRVIDREMDRVLSAAKAAEVNLIITADHGNLEQVLNPGTGRAETQHDSSPVPLYLVGPGFAGRKFANWRNIDNETMGILSDVAPTILELMEIPIPPEMNGRSLLSGLV